MQGLHRLNLLQVLQRRLSGGARRSRARSRPGGGRQQPPGRLPVLQGAEPEVRVLRHFVHAGRELLNRVPQLLDLARQVAHLVLELLQPHLVIRGDIARGGSAPPRGRRLAVVDLPLEVGELLLQPIDLLREGLDIVLRPRRRRAGEQDGHRQPGGRDDKSRRGGMAAGDFVI